MSHHKCECQKDNPKFKKLRAESICTLKLKAKKLKAKEADIETANINTAVVNTADITTLNVTNISIEGRDLTCSLQAQPVTQTSDQLQLFGVTGSTGTISPIIPDNVNPVVFNCLLNNALDYRSDLQCRLCDGRTRIANYLASKGCPPPCPAPVGSTGSECEGYTGCDPKNTVPLEFYGALTLPIYNRSYCGFTGTVGPSGATGVTGTGFNDFFNTAVNFNLQVTYLLEEAKSIDARNVSVLVQVGYVDSLGPTGGLLGCAGVTGGENVVIDEVFVANKQFYPTLDILYGENFANNIAIPTDLLNIAYLNSTPTSQGAIMMAIYKEEGLCIWTPKGDGSFECLKGEEEKNKNPPTGNSTQPANTNCVKGQKYCYTGGRDIGANVPGQCIPCNAVVQGIDCDRSQC